MLFDFFFQLQNFPAADISGVRDLRGILNDHRDNLQAAGICKTFQLTHSAGVLFRGQIHTASRQDRL